MTRDEKGFTLVEVLAALAIFGVIATIPFGFLNQSRYNFSSGRSIGAIAAAQRQLDFLRFQDMDDLPESGSETDSVDIGGVEYTVVTTYCGDMTYCTSTSNRHIRVEVYGPEKKLFDAETVFTQLK